jgi:hypothetical protein
MSKFTALLLAMALAGCATSPENKTEVTIKNHTNELLIVQVGSGILGTTVYLPPGGAWSGAVDRRWIQSSAWVEIRPGVPPAVR